jgi:hypothetical protein
MLGKLPSVLARPADDTTASAVASCAVVIILLPLPLSSSGPPLFRLPQKHSELNPLFACALSMANRMAVAASMLAAAVVAGAAVAVLVGPVARPLVLAQV